MRLLVTLREPAQIQEFLDLMETYRCVAKNQKYLEYMVTAPRGPNELYFSTEDTISRIQSSACVASVREAPSYVDFNCNDFV